MIGAPALSWSTIVKIDSVFSIGRTGRNKDQSENKNNDFITKMVEPLKLMKFLLEPLSFWLIVR